MSYEQFNQWNILGVKVYLPDGVQSTKEVPVEGLPESDVLAVNVYFDSTYRGPQGRAVYHKDTMAGRNFYWFKLPLYGATDRLAEVPVDAVILEGVEVEKDLYLKVYNTAYNDRMW